MSVVLHPARQITALQKAVAMPLATLEPARLMSTRWPSFLQGVRQEIADSGFAVGAGDGMMMVLGRPIILQEVGHSFSARVRGSPVPLCG